MTTAGEPGDGTDGGGTDYGYDMAHDDVSGGADEPERRRQGADVEVDVPGPQGRSDPDTGGDFGYDEAHDQR